jgi:hypothetical protein
MAIAALDSGGQFRIGSVINGAWNVFSANFPLFFGVGLFVGLPHLLFLRGTQASGAGWSVVIGIFAWLLLATIGQTVILYGAFRKLRGQPVDIGETLQRGLTRFLPLVGLAFLYSLGIMLGLLLLVVPGIILMVMWAVVVPACVVEGLSPTASMSRSSKLTKGHRWKIFGVMLLLLVLNFIASGMLALVLAPTGHAVATIGDFVWTAIWTAFWNCLLVMIYHDLRVAKEGIDTEQIAAIFD